MPLSWPARIPEQLWDQALVDVGRARVLANELHRWPAGNDDGDGASAWCRVGVAEARWGSVDVARTAGARARALFDHEADERGLALCRVIDALCLNREGRHTDALRALLDAHLLGAGDSREFEAFVYRSARAEIHASLVEVETALSDYYAALEIARRSTTPSPGIVAARELGEYHRRLGNFEDARRHGEDALLVAGRADAPQGVVASVAASLVHTYVAIGARDKARDLMSLLEADSGLPDPLGTRTDALALGYYVEGDAAKAGALIEAVAGRRDNGVSVFRSWLLARCHMRYGHWADANRIALKALALWSSAERPDHRYDLVKLYEVASECFEASGDSARALEHIRLLVAVRDRMLAFNLQSQYLELRLKHETARLRSERDSAVEMQSESERDIARLRELNRLLEARVLETTNLQAELRERSLRDPLTGLHNRRHLDEVAPSRLELARRQQAPLCVVMIDLDHFKKINDRYGHHTGDEVLKEFARLVALRARKSDIVCRYGGEEFVMLLADIRTEDAVAMLEKLLIRFQESSIPADAETLRGCSFSAGVASFPADGESLEALLRAADRRLYAAKAMGRARVEAYERGPFPRRR
ncbi:MAG TPA: GGDEF domain-containing protein [Burkholderiaceae bacterium]